MQQMRADRTLSKEASRSNEWRPTDAESELCGDDLDDWEAIWRWLVEVRIELQEKPEALAAWALEKPRSGIST